jgi:hypothetical protein
MRCEGDARTERRSRVDRVRLGTLCSVVTFHGYLWGLTSVLEVAMKRKLVIVFSVTATLLGVGASPALADSVSPSPAFGQHVSSVAPEHALASGAMFGDCVRTMARTGTCSHM